MPRKPMPKKIKRSRGVPPKPIDWAYVDELLEAGCLGTEVAAALGICAATLYLRVEEAKGMNFSAYMSEKRASGNRLLRKKQFDTAIEGDKTLLIWLGKQRLAQREDPSLAENTGRDLLKQALDILKILPVDTFKNVLDKDRVNGQNDE